MAWILGGLLLVALVSVILYNSKREHALAHTPTSPEIMDVPSLTQDSDQAAKREWFWSIVEMSREGILSQDVQAEKLGSILAQYTTSEIEAFVAEYDRVHDGSYSWNLWGAAYVAKGGCSDDCFHYFRSWMIANGRDFFAAAQDTPDQLAALIPPDYDGDAEFEDYSYVAGEVWSAKSGKNAAEMPRLETIVYQNGPAGEPFEESAESLSQRYPELWKRFASDPLG